MAPIAVRLRLPTWAQDVLLAGFVTLFQIRGTLLVAPSQSVERLDEPLYLGYAMLAVSGLALLVRRRRPVGVFVLVSAVSIAYYVGGYPDGPGWVSLFVALYTLTAQGDGHKSVKIATAVMAVLTAVWLLTADLRPLNAAGWVFFRIGAAIMAAALGESIRTRHELAIQARERAERAERLRIAREIHDTVAHAIAIINIQAGVTAHILDKRPHQAHQALVTIAQISAQAQEELRTTLTVLRDGDQDADDDHRAPTPGLSRLDELAQTAQEAGLDLKIEMSPSIRELPSAVDHAAYRILQESITNVIRHAGPAQVTISVTQTPADLEIQVTDNGHGPYGTADRRGGRGITGMRERTALLGGELTAGPRPGGGFHVRARLPIHPRQTAHQ